MPPPTLNTPETGLTYVWMTNLIANRYIPYSYDFPTKWDSQPPNHCTMPQTTYLSTQHILGYKGPTEEGYVGTGITGDELLPSLY